MTSPSGYDITFRAADDKTKLDHEIESYDGTTGALVAWVRIPTLSYTANTAIYMHYGDSNISGSQENKTGVWDSSYKGVWHLKENPTTTCSGSNNACDSTSNANHGTALGAMTSGDQVSGKISGSLDFDGSNDQIRLPDINAVDGASKYDRLRLGQTCGP